MQQFKDHHLFIPSVVILMLLACTWFSYAGIDWYSHCNFHGILPPHGALRLYGISYTFWQQFQQLFFGTV